VPDRKNADAVRLKTEARRERLAIKEARRDAHARREAAFAEALRKKPEVRVPEALAEDAPLHAAVAKRPAPLARP
jgi:hypothetical protein